MDTTLETAPDAAAFGLTQAAARRVGEILAQEGNADLRLRVSVSGGGCSGFQYGFNLDATQTADDLVVERDGVEVLVDTASVELLRGAVLDYVEDLVGSAFQIRNPNATSSCGCGNSFAV